MQPDPILRFLEERPVGAVTPFERGVARFLVALFEAYPTLATHAGDHRFDGRWPDLSEAGRAAVVAMLREWRSGFGALDPAGLTRDDRIDRGILLETIDGLLFEEEELREPAWDAAGYVRLLGDGLFSLLAREHVSWTRRGAAFVGRLEGVPTVASAARANLVGSPDRPVSRLHVETALAQLPGVLDLVDEGLRAADAHRGEPGAGDLPKRMAVAAVHARAALADLRAFLETDAMARASGEGRLGGELFARKLRHALGSDMAPDDVYDRAERAAELVRSEMVRLARGLWPALAADRPMERGSDRAPDPLAGDADDADAAVVRRVLAAIADRHPGPDELLERCVVEIGRLGSFVRDNGLIELPVEPLEIMWTPAFLRAYGGAFLDPPGPLEREQRAFFWFTPPAVDWSPDQVESYLREENDRMIALTCIHEAIPGHYLQLARANRSPSLVRSVFGSGTFAEGWAVYATQWMMDAGYARDDPALLLVHWKFFLRSAINAMLDVAIHTRDLDEEGAMRLMVEGGFQEEQEARAKYLRARLTSTQLSTYFVGSEELWDLELEVRRRRAVAVGGSASDVTPPRLVGDLGATPGFDARAHLEAVVSHGSPPIRWLRKILLDEPV